MKNLFDFTYSAARVHQTDDAYIASWGSAITIEVRAENDAAARVKAYTAIDAEESRYIWTFELKSAVDVCIVDNLINDVED
jgi:hypothetical protein